MICKYVNQKDSAAILATKRSAGVAPILRNSLNAGEKACTNLALKTRADVTKGRNRGISDLTKKDLCPPIFFSGKHPLVNLSNKFSHQAFRENSFTLFSVLLSNHATYNSSLNNFQNSTEKFHSCTFDKCLYMI